jgi:hypothetical protein
MESGEFKTMPIRDRLKARIDYILKPSGPISKEVVLQIKKIQGEIPAGAAWNAFEKIKNEAPAKLSATDSEYKKSSLWDAASKLVKMIFFYSPLVVMATDGRSPASQERKKIRTSAKEWRRYLTKTAEGRALVTNYKGTDGGKRIEEVMMHIMAGKSPKDVFGQRPR